MTKQRKTTMTFIAATAGVLLVLRGCWLLSNSLTFANVSEGQRLSGNAVILVHVRGSLHFVELTIDGHGYGFQNPDYYGDGQSGKLEQTARFDLPTYLYKNGLHTLRVKAGSRTYDQRHVMFVNGLHPG